MDPKFFPIRNRIFEIYFLNTHWKSSFLVWRLEQFSKVSVTSEPLLIGYIWRTTKDLLPPGLSIPEPLSCSGNCDEVAVILVKTSGQIPTQNTLSQWTMTPRSCPAGPQDKVECKEPSSLRNGIGHWKLMLLFMVITQIHTMLMIQNLFLLYWLFNMLLIYGCYWYLLSSVQFTSVQLRAEQSMEFLITAICPPHWMANLSSGREGFGLIDLKVLPTLTFCDSVCVATSLLSDLGRKHRYEQTRSHTPWT